MQRSVRTRRAHARCNPAALMENTAAITASRREIVWSCGATVNTPPAGDAGPMLTPPSDATPPIAALASACARQLPTAPASFASDAPAFQTALDALLAAVAAGDARYTFDREGRPPALQAVRSALPAMEAELFDVILEDLACELAATQEALYQLALAARATDR
jgi:hypothetical protein